MDKNTLTAFTLIALIFFVFTYINRPKEDPNAPKNATNTEAVSGDSTATNAAAEPISNVPQSSAGLLQQIGTQTPLSTASLENEYFTIKFTNKGAQIDEVILKKYKDYTKAPLQLIAPDDNQFYYEFFINNQKFVTKDFNFELQASDAQKVVYRLYADSTRQSYIEQTYTLSDDSYGLDYAFSLVGLGDKMSNNSRINLVWNSQLKQQEQNISNERLASAINYYDMGDEMQSFSKDGTEEVNAQVQWIAHKQRFFNQTLIVAKDSPTTLFAVNNESTTPTAPQDSSIVKTFQSNMVLTYDNKPEFATKMEMLFAPNDYNLLKSKKIGLENQIYLGWAIFGWVNKWLIIPIFNFLQKYIGSYGIIIALLTLIIKILITPMTYRSYLSMAKMRVLRPELDELKEKYGSDMQRLQQEQMKLYSKAGVSPFGGCLPQLLQFPVLIAMYNFFPSSINLRQQSFLWATDLSTYDSIMQLPFKIPFYGDHVSLFTLLMAGVTFLSMRFNNQSTSMGNPAAEAQMKIMQWIMPVFLIFIFNNFSSALTYYYTLYNVLNLIQQWIMNKYFIDEDKIHRQIQENKKKPAKQSSFAKKLEDMMKQQQAQQNNADKKSKR
ncbi:MAG: membrane protein insertase YidC [Chitinophagales bacterium]|nr:membrane protein insertase YidC [Bacteroidota bacterium]MCB9043727.1 membrane protein insertase YidC [Chitinophagales bacterium]